MKRLCLGNKSPWVRRFFPPVQDRITAAVVAAVNEPEPQTPPAEGMRSSEIAGVDFKRMTEREAEYYIEHNITNEAKAELQRRVPGANPEAIAFQIRVLRDALDIKLALVTAREQAPILEEYIHPIVEGAIQDLPYLRDLMFMYVQIMQIVRNQGLTILPNTDLLRKLTIEAYNKAHGDEEQIQGDAEHIVNDVLYEAISEMGIKRMQETNVLKGRPKDEHTEYFDIRLAQYWNNNPDASWQNIEKQAIVISKDLA